jgi:hypothetical protein
MKYGYKNSVALPALRVLVKGLCLLAYSLYYVTYVKCVCDYHSFRRSKVITS